MCIRDRQEVAAEAGQELASGDAASAAEGTDDRSADATEAAVQDIPDTYYFMWMEVGLSLIHSCRYQEGRVRANREKIRKERSSDDASVECGQAVSVAVSYTHL